MAGLASAATTYTIGEPCGETPCIGLVMNDEGAIAGLLVPSGAEFAWYPDTGIVQFDAQGGYPWAMNSDGVVVGQGSGGDATAFIPSTATLFNLDPVFGWTGGTAVAINDSGQIIGIPNDGSAPEFSNLVPGLNVTSVTNLNNAGQITGVYRNSANATGYFLYTPGQGIVDLPGYPLYMNQNGQVLCNTASGQFSYSIFSPGQPLISVGAAGLEPGPLNDALQVPSDFIDGAPMGPSVWSPSTGFVSVYDLLPADSGWSVAWVRAINNRGQIMLNVYPTVGDGETTIILTPVNETAEAPPSHGNARPFDCRELRLNGRDVCGAAASRR